MRLFRAQRRNGIASCRALGGQPAAEHGEQGAQNNQHKAGKGRKRGADILLPCQGMEDGVSGKEQQQRHPDADHARQQSDDKGFCVENLRDIALGRADGTQNSDLLSPLHDADVGDNADHDGRNHQRDGHKGHQHIGDHVHNIGDRGHHGAHQISVLINDTGQSYI